MDTNKQSTFSMETGDCKSDRASRVEEASNNSTVALRVVGDDKKETLESETVKYGRKSHGTRTRE
jgi:hypothetical protein